MRNPLEIAPPDTWLRVLAAALLITLGLVAVGHAQMLRRSAGGRFEGPLAATGVASAFRWSGILLVLAALLVGVEVRWALAVNVALALVACALLAAELVARLRGRAVRRGDS